MTPAALRSWLRAWRQERRLTQAEAAAILGKNARQWQRMEAGEAPVSQETTMALGYYTLTGQTRFPPAMPAE